MCPFCYIGKRKFELALATFPNKEHIEIEWKSFQLQPELLSNPSISVYEHLAQSKGWSLAQTKQISAQVSQTAAQVGLTYDFDKAVVANTFMAHVLLHIAKEQGKQNETKEALLKAYFTEGKNVDDTNILIQIAKEVGLETNQLAEELKNESHHTEVKKDIREAQQLGIRGVPFFVFDRKYAISGAQEPTAFLQTLEQSFGEWREKNPETSFVVTEGESCEIDGNC